LLLLLLLRRVSLKDVGEVASVVLPNVADEAGIVPAPNSVFKRVNNILEGVSEVVWLIALALAHDNFCYKATHELPG